MFDFLDIPSTGLYANRVRMNAIAENIASKDVVGVTELWKSEKRNANKVDPEVYQRNEVLFSEMLDDHGRGLRGVQVANVGKEMAPPNRVYRPNHGYADKDGFILEPNVTELVEMTDMVLATRSFEANIAAFEAGKQMLLRSLDLLA